MGPGQSPCLTFGASIFMRVGIIDLSNKTSDCACLWGGGAHEAGNVHIYRSREVAGAHFGSWLFGEFKNCSTTRCATDAAPASSLRRDTVEISGLIANQFANWVTPVTI